MSAFGIFALLYGMGAASAAIGAFVLSSEPEDDAYDRIVSVGMAVVAGAAWPLCACVLAFSKIAFMLMECFDP